MKIKIGLLLSLIYLSISPAAQAQKTAAEWLKARDSLESGKLSADESEQYCLNACQQMLSKRAEQDLELLEALEGFLVSHWHHLTTDEIKDACNNKIKSKKSTLRQNHEQRVPNFETLKPFQAIPSIIEETWSGQVQVFDERKSEVQCEKSSPVDLLENKKHLGQVLDFSDAPDLQNKAQTSEYEDQLQGSSRHLYDEIEKQDSKPTSHPATTQDWDYNPTQEFDVFGDQVQDFG